MASIFSYTDYRKYLKDVFAARKKIDPKVSHRWLAAQLGLSTSNFMMLVMQGKRNLNAALCHRLSEVLRHTQKEAAYFENLVGFAQSKTVKEKDLYFSRMMATRKNLKVDRIEEWQYKYYTDWYNPVVRELVTDSTFDGDLAALARRLLPSITPGQARQSVELLLRLGMIRKDGERYVQTAPYISTGPEVNSVAVANFHRTMGRLGMEAVDRFNKKDRNITSSTLMLTRNTFSIITKKIEGLREEILALATPNGEGEGVYQINFQAFPVTKVLTKKETVCAAENPVPQS
jgi:uncharacterized protein (TIGR02147 family)